jgi:hypothetical protein
MAKTQNMTNIYLATFELLDRRSTNWATRPGRIENWNYKLHTECHNNNGKYHMYHKLSQQHAQTQLYQINLYYTAKSACSILQEESSGGWQVSKSGLLKVIPQFCIAHFYCAYLITYNFIHYTYRLKQNIILWQFYVTAKHLWLHSCKELR